MNQKSILLSLVLILASNVLGRSQQTIKVIVPNKADEVYITGNQESLGNWDPGSIKMKKISEYERSIEVDLNYPAEFKFTKGDWSSEGIIKNLTNNPNIQVESKDARNIFMIKGWSDNPNTEVSGLEYDVVFLESNYVSKGRQIKIALPLNYNPQKKYPVCYITDGGSRNFDIAKNYLESLSGEPYNNIPESILVGIVHGGDGTESNRNKDLDVFYKTSGHNFKDFIFNELIPYINEQYNTSGFNVIIGHSNGAEYNHFLFLEEDNPFRGFISISSNFYSNDVRKIIGSSIRSYEGNQLYYFVANGKEDAPSRIDAGNDYEAIFKSNKNKKISSSKRDFEGGHNSMVPRSLFEGLQFIFQDYKNYKKYSTFKEYKKNYPKDLKSIYGIKANYSLSDINDLVAAIFEDKDEEELTAYFQFVEEEKLWQNQYMAEAGGFDAMNIGNMYYMIGSYDKSAREYAKALDELEITVEPAVYYYNFDKILTSYKETNRYDELMEIILRSRDSLFKNPRYMRRDYDQVLLMLNYNIAKLSREENIKSKEGEIALKYCEEKFVKNSYFTFDDLEQLKS